MGYMVNVQPISALMVLKSYIHEIYFNY